MIDREKVIKALEGIGIALDMDGHHNDAQAVRDALALLKEQEPRVMMLEEVRSGSVEVAWIEDKNRRIFGSDIIPGLWFRLSNVGEDEAVDIHIRDGFVGARLAVYGKMWRAWTSRPTEEQRKAVKWDG